MTESTSKGKFITFEGIDGCGKTTQAEKLLELLEKKELSISFIREPGGDPISESIRNFYCMQRNLCLIEQKHY
ncbi:MAG: hypothetical protein Ct9H90mP15_06220 [Candidatus Neomarinimicrobiota bacterium]|nr:MAG: hypothetical protein Ct9H90mP15_06220 [Candidatus Neomarinimicrobiota bacterium]